MEYENHYASNGKGNLGVTLGAVALGTSLLGGNGNLFGGILGGNCCGDNRAMTKFEATQAARIAELETEVKLRDANTYTDSKLLDLYKYVDGKFACVEGQIANQAVYNATNTATLNCISGQVAQLMGLTKTIIPITNVCPEPMKMYNSWTAPTATT